MTRVGLGHTGRPLVASRGVALAYGLVHVGAFVRVGSGLLPTSMGALALAVAGMLWSAAFGLFVALYASALFGPRVDARPG